jgi:hypothetical protein
LTTLQPLYNKNPDKQYGYFREKLMFHVSGEHKIFVEKENDLFFYIWYSSVFFWIGTRNGFTYVPLEHFLPGILNLGSVLLMLRVAVLSACIAASLAQPAAQPP